MELPDEHVDEHENGADDGKRKNSNSGKQKSARQADGSGQTDPHQHKPARPNHIVAACHLNSPSRPSQTGAVRKYRLMINPLKGGHCIVPVHAFSSSGVQR
ncbi:hypothetical protein FRACA_2200007 [Frankia canadensis]|uniref:Uncharacterized protein n=1 Tax=Frankia canadensis TaxID=1836972 RepID=A0A2I2KR20_9ACTN|nr:hypothetical protein FRACA_2200007 [Frankia canadensis]SOU55403.1 hypothetical protein FRACA_2200007 [Frankia canadensis]